MRAVVGVIVDEAVQAERDRLVALIQTDTQLPLPTLDARPRIRRETSARYGAVAGPVRDALTELSNAMPAGVGASDIADFFARSGDGPKLAQIRAALKQLHTRGDAIRGERGRYLSREAVDASAPSGEVPDEQPSGFSLAAD